MANPRRTSFSPSGNQNHQQLPISTSPFQNQNQNQGTQISSLMNSLKSFLKKPHAFPFLLSLFLFLTWVSLRFQRPSTSTPHREEWHAKVQSGSDQNANLVRFLDSSSSIAKDKRGWLINPISLALDSAISGGAAVCASVHLGEIRSGGLRGNHRHHTCNETFVIWGAKTVFRVENDAVKKGYAEVIIGADEVAVAVSPLGTAHALVNVDPVRSTYFMGCQDSVINYNGSTTDFNVWKDL
ncbi:uncharacterized protein [Solanum tuberosum]|uniref:Cupin, RmlC-type n=1 Tax=Solanum tuberosum TaxID=4113 RepID=M1AAT2_SOLTU|nr:PREDICTED: uncharacterized protein LOC102598362 [Solanum tuberosum]KAH0723352.1 hypothetical protein KY289_006396 [Solanum tuberosum]